MTRKLRLSPYPTAGSITITNGTVHPIHRGGNFIRVREADQEFTIRLDNETELKGTSLNDIIELEKGDTFQKIEVVNDSGSDLTFQLDIGYGKISTNSVSINGTIKTDDDETQTLLTTIDTVLDNILALLKNPEELRSGFNDLSGMSYYSCANTTTSIVTAGANVNGVIIGSLHGTSTGGTGTFRIDGNDVFYTNGTAGNQFVVSNPIFVPAGVSVDMTSNNASTIIRAYAKVL